MAKMVSAVLKLKLSAGQATPAYPVGLALGSPGANIMAFVREYNEQTAPQTGVEVTAVITI